MQDPTATDVITFPGDPQMGFAGEICVSIDHAEAFSRRRGTDFSRELALYLVHGYLHLVGYDDLKPEWKRKMRAAEKKALSWLDKSGHLPEFRIELR
jgi:probable rRNA maturation factor